MIFFDNETGEFQIRDEPLLPPNVTPNDVEVAAREYWLSISERHWATLEFEMRRRVIRYVMNDVAMTWALKTAGLG